MGRERIFSGEGSGRTFIRGKQIGEPNFGIVYHISEVSTSDTFALKVPYPLDDHKNAVRLRKEAGLQKSFNHPNITRVELSDLTRDLLSGIEVPMLITPLAQIDLAKRIKRPPRLTPTEIVDFSEDVATALATLHAQNTLHLDIKLANILLNNDSGELGAELTDFGEAEVVDHTGIYPITPQQFLFPDDMYDGKITALTEQFNWAANIVYPMIAGIPDFFPIDENVPTRPLFEDLIGSRRMSSHHEVLEKVVDRAIQTNPVLRYPSMADLLEDLSYERAKAAEKVNRARTVI